MIALRLGFVAVGQILLENLVGSLEMECLGLEAKNFSVRVMLECQSLPHNIYPDEMRMELYQLKCDCLRCR